MEALEKKKESLKNAKERMIRQQEETEQKKENERERELKLLEFLRQADEIETQYDHLQKEELKLHVQTEKNHELCKEKEAYLRNFGFMKRLEKSMIRSECKEKNTEIDCQTGRIDMTVIKQDFWQEI